MACVLLSLPCFAVPPAESPSTRKSSHCRGSLFEQSDDATRFAYQLEDDGYPEMNVIEVEDEVMLKTCHVHNYNFTVITPNDIVIPPSEKHDFI